MLTVHSTRTREAPVLRRLAVPFLSVPGPRVADRPDSGVGSLMKLVNGLLFLSCLVPLQPACANSLTEDCEGPAVQMAVDCLQPKLDARIRQAQIEFNQTVNLIFSSQRDAPQAAINAKSVTETLRAAQNSWQTFADHECAAERDFVGNGNDRNNVELSCFIRLYDQRIQELRSWRGL